MSVLSFRLLRLHPSIHPSMHACMHAYIRIYIYIYTHTHSYIHVFLFRRIFSLPAIVAIDVRVCWSVRAQVSDTRKAQWPQPACSRAALCLLLPGRRGCAQGQSCWGHGCCLSCRGGCSWWPRQPQKKKQIRQHWVRGSKKHLVFASAGRSKASTLAEKLGILDLTRFLSFLRYLLGVQ